MKYLRFSIFSQRGSERKAARFCALQRVYQSIEYREPHDGSKIYSERDGYDVSQFEFFFFLFPLLLMSFALLIFFGILHR